MLTTIPLIAFGIVSFFAGKYAEKFGAGRMMLAGLILLLAGIVVRSYAGVTGLFVGTAVIGTGIAIQNVLVPAIIKAHFPKKVGVMTASYTTMMATLSGISGGISVPLANAIGWRNTLFMWVFIVSVALVLWIINRDIKLKPVDETEVQTNKHADVTKDPMSWFIACFMGIQSLLFYCFVAWFATIVQSNGFDKVTAGYFNSAYLFLGITGSLTVPVLAGRRKNQSLLAVALGIIYTVGLAALTVNGGLSSLIISMVCCGFCQGATISFSMMLFGLHTKNPTDTSALSGLAQSIGYLLASVGPIILGKVYDIAGNWNAPLAVLVVLAIVLTVLGFIVGQEKIING